MASVRISVPTSLPSWHVIKRDCEAVQGGDSRAEKIPPLPLAVNPIPRGRASSVNLARLYAMQENRTTAQKVVDGFWVMPVNVRHASNRVPLTEVIGMRFTPDRRMTTILTGRI